MAVTWQQRSSLPTQPSSHPFVCRCSSGTTGLELFQAAVNGECHTMEYCWANSLTTSSPEMGTGAIMEGLALEREEAQPLYSVQPSLSSQCPLPAASLAPTLGPSTPLV